MRESWFTRSHTVGICGMIPRPACGASYCVDSGTAGRGSFPQTSGVRSAGSGCAARVGAKSAPHPPPYPVRGRLFGHPLPARGEKGTDMACARGGAAVRVHPGSVEFDSLSPRAGRGCRRRVRGERSEVPAAPVQAPRSAPHPPSGHLLPADAGRRKRGSVRQMLDRRDRTEAVGQALQQRKAVGAHGRVVRVDHHAVEERIHLRAQARLATSPGWPSTAA